MRRILFAIGLLALTVMPMHAQASPGAGDDAARWKPLQFLLGTWEAKTAAGGQVQSQGTYSFTPELHGTILARHSLLARCKGPSDYDCNHGDMLYLFHDAGKGANDSGIRAIYFDNEGHVIHYVVTIPSPTKAVLQSEPGPGPQFRLTYELSAGIMTGKFEVAPPGQAEYHTYLQWDGGRK